MWKQVINQLWRLKDQEPLFRSRFDEVFDDAFWLAQRPLWAKYNGAVENDYVYIIDVVSRCNLRCSSCAVGNSPPTNSRAYMPVDVFRKIADRIASDSRHLKPYVALYNWGEAPLHKELDKIVSLLRERNIHSEVSTNLNLFPNMEGVLIAGWMLSEYPSPERGMTPMEGLIAGAKLPTSLRTCTVFAKQ